MDHATIGKNVRLFREARQWTQEELALASGVDVRTVQRAEASKPLALDTLKAIAAAFDTTIEVLSVSEEQVAATLKDFEKKYKIIQLQALKSGGQIGAFMAGAHAFQAQRVGEFAEEQLDIIAEFESYARDYLDVWSDFSPLDRREAEKAVQGLLDQLSSGNVSVAIGAEDMRLKSEGREPFTFNVIHFAFTSGHTPMLTIAREKNMPVQFV